MRELYDKHKPLFTIIGIFVFWAIVYTIMPSIERAPTAEQGNVAKEITFSLLAGVILGILATPLAMSAFDSFRIFFTSPIFKRRWKKFKTLRRGYYSFIIIVIFFVLSLFSEFLINNRAIMVKYQGSYHFTLTGFTSAREFGLQGYGLPNFRHMKQVFNVRNQERAERIANGNATEED